MKIGEWRRMEEFKMCSYLRGGQVAEAWIVALDGRLLDESAGSDALRFAIAQVTRTHTVGPVVEAIGPNSKRGDERQEEQEQDKIRHSVK